MDRTLPSSPEEGAPLTESMQNLAQQAMELLDFPRIRHMLAGRTRFFLSREQALEILPQVDLEDVKRLQDETEQAAGMLDSVGDIGLVGHGDPNDSLRRAALGGTLEGTELIALVQLFDSIWAARQVVLKMNGRAPLLEAIANDVPDLRDLKTKVMDAVSETGDVKDGATPRLGRLRKDAAQAYQRVVRMLERTVSTQEVRQALQSPNIASRGERLVLEVRAEFKWAVPGIVHDVSNTGSTVFIEPFKAVELCNEWREKAAEAKREEERVLRDLSGAIGGRRDEAERAIFAAADLDLIVARARLARSMKAERPITLDRGEDPAARLVEARHPLLGEAAVPVSVDIGPGFRGLVVTGPNTGGKTVAIKTIGLFALMHQCGLQLPCSHGTTLAVFDKVFADIGDAQSIDRSVSTFSSHMGRVIQILQVATADSLVLLDELGTGTDPEEGSAIARSVLEYLVGNNVPVAVTSHYRAVAEFAGSHPMLRNASVDLDPETMLPTYKLITGIPGRSYAMQVASHLGMPDEVLERAKSFLDPSHTEAQRLLSQLQKERDDLAKAVESARKDAIEAETARRDLQERLKHVARQQEDLVERTRMDLRREAEDVRRQLRRIVSQTEQDKDLAVAQRAVNRLRANLATPTWLPITPPKDESDDRVAVDDAGPIEPGDTVEVKGMDVRAKVLSLGKDGQAELQMGNARIELDARQLRKVIPRGDTGEASRGPDVRISTAPSNASSELDIRGHRVAEIEQLVPEFLDRCALQGLERVRIIHGAGTGALREAVREMIAASPHTKAFAPGEQGEGGNGVTVVELA